MVKLLVLLLLVEYLWSPRFDWVEESKMLLLYYDYKNSRKYIKIFKL